MDLIAFLDFIAKFQTLITAAGVAILWLIAKDLGKIHGKMEIMASRLSALEGFNAGIKQEHTRGK